jgi:hypothetical protein
MRRPVAAPKNAPALDQFFRIAADLASAETPREYVGLCRGR